MVHPPIDLPLLRYAGLGPLSVQLEKFKPTVLHGLCESQSRLTRRLACRLDVPYVQMVNSLPKGLSTLSTAPPRCAAIVVSAETIGTRLAKMCLPSADRVRRINMGTFVAEEVVCFSDASQLPSIVMAEPLHRVSDLEVFFRVVKNLLADGYEFMVVVMGTGTGERRLRRFLADEGLSWAVTIIPVLNPWRCVLGAGDIFVQPRPLRAFSGYLLEAMSLGTAVAACLGGVDDLIIPNQTAVVFEPDDEPSIRQALAQLLDAHDFARRLAGTAQEHVRACYSVSTMISATLETYAEAHQGRRD
jgi:glycosyltransferase involved in cell wall biosynthesis